MIIDCQGNNLTKIISLCFRDVTDDKKFDLRLRLLEVNDYVYFYGFLKKLNIRFVQTESTIFQMMQEG
ncbi:hypothetical protein M445_05605 [Vibrio owensii 47666-1]|nr:hypothetical protein M445_05605 [Vibrio owensii 47666-1]